MSKSAKPLIELVLAREGEQILIFLDNYAKNSL